MVVIVIKILAGSVFFMVVSMLWVFLMWMVLMLAGLFSVVGFDMSMILVFSIV